MGFSRILQARLDVVAQRAPQNAERNEFRIDIVDIDVFETPFLSRREVRSTRRVAATVTFPSPTSTKPMRNFICLQNLTFPVTTNRSQNFRYQILASRSCLPDPGFQILATRSWVPSHGFHILAARSWLPHPGCQILAIRSWQVGR